MIGLDLHRTQMTPETSIKSQDRRQARIIVIASTTLIILSFCAEFFDLEIRNGWTLLSVLHQGMHPIFPFWCSVYIPNCIWSMLFADLRNYKMHSHLWKLEGVDGDGGWSRSRKQTVLISLSGHTICSAVRRKARQWSSLGVDLAAMWEAKAPSWRSRAAVT